MTLLPAKTVDSIDGFEAWLRSLSDLNAGLWIWTYFLHSRFALDFAFEETCAGAPGVKRERRGLPLFTLSRTVGRDEPRRVDAWFVLNSIPNTPILKLITVSDREVWHKAILPFVKERSPRVAPVYFMQTELLEGFRELQRSLQPGLRLNLTRASTKERIALRGRQHRAGKRYRSNVTYTDESIDAVFDLAKERGQSFKSLSLDVESGGSDADREVVASMTVSNQGCIAWSRLAKQLDLQIESTLFDRAQRRLALFRSRDLRARNYEADKPLAIEFEASVFEDARAVRSFGSVMLRYPSSATAVLHENPYFHMLLADEQDGSSMDLWILNPRRILVVPRLNTSEAALNRLLNFVSENFREAHVTEYDGDE